MIQIAVGVVGFIIKCRINVFVVVVVVGFSFDTNAIAILIGSLFLVINSYNVGKDVVVVVDIKLAAISTVPVAKSSILFNGGAADWSPINCNKMKTIYKKTVPNISPNDVSIGIALVSGS